MNQTSVSPGWARDQSVEAREIHVETDTTSTKLQDLVDRADILDCLHRYARGMDRLDRELVRSAYHDGAIDDHVGFVGPVDDFIDWAFEYHATQARHQHFVTNHNIELDGDCAHVETYFLFVATERDAGAPLTMFGGRYVDRFERRNDRWAIAARLCVVEWATSPTSLLPPDMSELNLVGTLTRDRTDVSYERPLMVKRAPTAG
jgi:hypothetical protein